METALVLDQFGERLGSARRAYQRFLKAGLPLRHENKYYETIDQRFLGDERFVAEVARRTDARRDVQIHGPRVAFRDLLRAVARVQQVENPSWLVQPGRRRF